MIELGDVYSFNAIGAFVVLSVLGVVALIIPASHKTLEKITNWFTWITVGCLSLAGVLWIIYIIMLILYPKI